MCNSSWTRSVFAPCTQQEEEKRRQKIETWENMQQGKSSKGHKLSEVSLNFWIEFLSIFPSGTLSPMSQAYFSICLWDQGTPGSGRIFTQTFSQINLYETLSSASIPLWSHAWVFWDKAGLNLGVFKLLIIALKDSVLSSQVITGMLKLCFTSVEVIFQMKLLETDFFFL